MNATYLESIIALAKANFSAYASFDSIAIHDYNNYNNLSEVNTSVIDPANPRDLYMWYEPVAILPGAG